MRAIENQMKYGPRGNRISGDSEMITNPIFLVGTMRSGTTFFPRLLQLSSSNKIIPCGFELTPAWVEVGGVPIAAPAVLGHNICPPLTALDKKTGQAERLRREFHRRMCSAIGSTKIGGRRFLNKNPHLCNKLPLVSALFPDAQFIWIRRHILPVVASIKLLFEQTAKKELFWHYWPEPHPTGARCWNGSRQNQIPKKVEKSRIFPGGAIKHLAEYWLENNEAVSAHLSSLSQKQWHAINHENLISQPVKILNDCHKFLNLPKTAFDAKPFLEDRNRVWGERLTQQEKSELTDFVVTHKDRIRLIFSK